MSVNQAIPATARPLSALGIALSSLLFLLPGAGWTATVSFAVDGPNGGSEPLGEGLAPGFAQSFTMTETLTDAAISFDLFCVPSCSASLYLINGVPNPLAGVAQYETDRSFSGAGNFAYTLAGRTLSAGVTYTLILSILDGNGLWRSTRTPQVTGTSVMIGDSWLMTSLDIGYPALSAFQPFSGVTAKFSIKGEAIRPPSAVPLPPGLPLLLVALGVLARRRAT